MEQEKRWCVYAHVFPNNKSYIGITSIPPKHRWGGGGKNYLRKNKNGSYQQPAMAHAINKYCKNPGDWDKLVEHIILFDNLEKDQACHIEELLIELFQLRDHRFGYNMARGGNLTFVGRKHTKETKEFLRQLNKKQHAGENNPMFGKHHTEETKRKNSLSHKRTPVVQLTLTNNIVAIYQGVNIASKETGFCRDNISSACRGELHTSHGYRWKFVYDRVCKNGTIIPGAITLGLITEEEALSCE